MTSLAIAGGFYREQCIRPLWNEFYGSGGRAAAAVAPFVPTKLYTYVEDAFLPDLEAFAERCGFQACPTTSPFQVSFGYMHPLSVPVIRPPLHQMRQQPSITVKEELVLRYGMLEGDAVVQAKVAIYDPQSAFDPPRFSANGSTAERLAIVLNRYEGASMVGSRDPGEIAKRLMADEKAEVVVVKMGSQGAYVVWQGGADTVPAYQSDHVWKVGSGDVFSATFAALWGAKGVPPLEAADFASRATAYYCSKRSLPIPDVASLASLGFAPVKSNCGKIYLAGPFFDLGQRWLVEEARNALLDMGAEVFSPVHEVGPGPADVVAPADIKGLEECSVVLALLNGLDAGTIFEIGYAIKKGIPVVIFAENIKEEDLKMMAGTGCVVYDDFTSAIYQTLWRCR